ncbi:hypothetical protein [Xanthomarina gelatinilytica]|uniref:hypothetical protein n=1 Tax=Xanthomarina gelatinilytica TaxID=1137281 RepID=UPI003AA8F1DF
MPLPYPDDECNNRYSQYDGTNIPAILSTSFEQCFASLGFLNHLMIWDNKVSPPTFSAELENSLWIYRAKNTFSSFIFSTGTGSP